MRVAKQKSLGFSLIELLVVTTLIAVLTAAVIVSFRQANHNARDSKRKADIQEIRGVLENYRLENGAYPDAENETINGEVSNDGTFLENVPANYTSRSYADPVNDETYYYRYTIRDLPGCRYQLVVKMETGNGQSCAACQDPSIDSTYYCTTD